MSDTTIFHNPNCSTSRQVLQTLRDAGLDPTVVDYMKVGWTEAELRRILSETGLTARQLMRTRGDLPGDLGLDDPSVGDETILKAMLEHPVLVERPVVRTARGTVLARPKEKVEEIL
jgi:arsenate reductase